jgi:hypothetical protein
MYVRAPDVPARGSEVGGPPVKRVPALITGIRVNRLLRTKVRQPRLRDDYELAQAKDDLGEELASIELLIAA